MRIMDMVQLERALDRTEHLLSVGAACTVVLPLFGCIKMKLGVIQLTAAVSSAIFATMFYGGKEQTELVERSLEHIMHGMGNIVTGFFESIPYLQTVMNIKYFATGFAFNNGNKALPYRSLMLINA